MRLTGFEISNFKGIKRASLRFAENDVARVHTLVGLNESGKTTLLEALHSFSPDAETELVVKSARTVEQQREQWIPRAQISNFTGEIKVRAFVEASEQEWEDVLERFAQESDLVIDEAKHPGHFTLDLVHAYKNGDFVKAKRIIGIEKPRVRTKRAKNFRDLTTDEWNALWREIEREIPTVAYYPTFVFDFPKRIYLTDRDGSPRNKFYRQLFQDILDFDGSGYTIEESILARLHKAETQGPWEKWFSEFVGTSEEDKVKQVIARAERAVTTLVFSRWNEVFGENSGGKQITIDLQYEKGKMVENDDGTEEEPDIHDAYIRFRLKDGSNLYSVEDRSLGFRWFFSFLLFTQFRIHRENQRPTIFLFDEPASNLHAAAQKKLLESFPAIARPPHRLVYSTHSHYMVEPRWLEQAFIVHDASATSEETIMESGIHDDSTVDVQVVQYRKFVQTSPGRTSYFQPILDTLDVQPSSFDYQVGGLIVEGKADYYAIKLAERVSGREIGPVFPACGSGTLGALVALHRGWGLPVRVLLDADRGGKDGKRNLTREFSLTADEHMLADALLEGLVSLEDLIGEACAVGKIGDIPRLQKVPALRQIQEWLAADAIPDLPGELQDKLSRLLNNLDAFMAADAAGQQIAQPDAA